MSEKPQDPDEPKQKTPKGPEIPLPKRSEIMDALRRVARPDKKS